VFHPLKPAPKTHPSGLRRFQKRLHVEELESRTLLSVYTPLQIRHAYGVDQITFNNGTVQGDGSGQTIAIVDAYYDPTITSDLAAFSRQFGLAQLDGKTGDGTFTQVDLSGKTLSPPGDDWTMETALDVEWAHAIAPKANIVLVEAASDNVDPTGKPTDLLSAVQYAATRTGASTVSMSWGVPEVPGETSWDSVFTTPGVTFVAASGDSGAGTTWPAVSPNVVSVGGTTLRLTSSNTIASETGWGNGSWSWYFGGSGGGISQYEPLPSFQQNAGISPTYTQFGARLNPDVAYNADPNTGYYVLDGADGGWYSVGGTSAGAPQWAALIAIANQGRAAAQLSPLSSSQTLSALYSNPQDFHDIKQGNTGTYALVNGAGQLVGFLPVTARTGYDLVTGLGTPVANALVPALARVGAPAAATSAAPASSSAGGSSSHGSSTTARSADVVVNSENPPPAPAPSTNSSVSATSGSPGDPAAIVLAGVTGVPARPVTVASPNPGPGNFIVAVAPAIPSQGAFASPPAAISPGHTGGTMDLTDQDLTDQDQPPADNQPTEPDAPELAPATPGAPVSQVVRPERSDCAPVVANALDAGFISEEALSELPLPGSSFGPVHRSEAGAVLALFFALVWGRRDRGAPAQDREQGNGRSRDRRLGKS
jgi:hypothetical protein